MAARHARNSIVVIAFEALSPKGFGRARSREEALEEQMGNAYHAIRGDDTVRIVCTRWHRSHTTDSGPWLQYLPGVPLDAG